MIVMTTNKSAISFRQWLHKAQVTDDAAGDLIADLRSNLRDEPEEFPHFRTKHGLKRHLLNRDACDNAVQTIPTVWRRYLLETRS